MILLVGNWKAAPEKRAQAEKILTETTRIAKSLKRKVKMVSCVPVVHLSLLAKKSTLVSFGAQNVSSFTEGAHTGEITAGMIREAGARYALVGHSEARALGEGNDLVAQKILRLMEKNITPILCVGEGERDAHGWYLSAIKEQLGSVLQLLTPEKAKKLIIAYEPIWAIGEKALREATPEECHEMMLFIRKVITDTYNTKVARAIPLLYGGSVNEINANLFTTHGEADGLLVGRVSLEPKRFSLLAKKIVTHEISR